MIPFDGVSAEDGFVDKTPKKSYKAIQGTKGKFIDNILDMSEGLRAEDITPEVSKSYIPGKGWVPATQAGKKALRGAKGAHAKAKGVTPRDESIRNALSQTDLQAKLQSSPAGTMKVGRGRTAQVNEASSTGPYEAYAYMSGRTRNMVVKPGADPRVVRHEAAHLSPRKRTPYRMVQIGANPQKAMREEARADMVGGFKYRDPQARKPGGFYSGYANAAATPRGAGSQRKQGRQIDTQQRIAGLLTGDREKLQSRSKMFNQKSLSAYRETQDRIDAARGVNYKRSTRQMNNRNRAADATRTYGPTVAGAGIIGANSYANRKDKVRKSLFTPKLPRPPRVPKPATAVKMPKLNPIARVPKTTTASPLRPRIRETGVSKAERGELVALQFPKNRQVRFTRVRKSSPDASEVHVMGGGRPVARSARQAAAQRAARTRRMKGFRTPTQ